MGCEGGIVKVLDPEVAGLRGKPFHDMVSVFPQRQRWYSSRHFEVSFFDPSITIKSGDDGTSTLW